MLSPLAPVASGVRECALAGGGTDLLAVGGRELELGQLLLGCLAASVGGLREERVDGVARH
jgi:hypothetical protein